MARRAWLFVAVAWLCAPLTGHALYFNYGVGEDLSTRQCIAGATPCDTLSSTYFSGTDHEVFGGQPGGVSASASMTSSYGTAAASVSLSGVIGAPIIRASATSEPGYRINTNSYALQSYTYTGSESATRTFGGTITYSQNYVSGLGLTDGNIDEINAVIYLFTLATPTLDFGTDPVSNFYELCCGIPYDYTNLWYSQYTDPNSTTAGSGTVGVTVTLNPGETIWVMALLQTPVADGSTIDASHTFITGWDNTSNLTPAITVPEPTALALVGAGFMTMFLTRRRERHGSRQSRAQWSLRQ